MIKFSKKIEYALIALIEVSKHSAFDLVSAKTIASQYHIPHEILGKVLQTLKRKGLLESVQGVKGGYTLKSGLNDINLLNVVEAIDGPVSLVSCTGDNICDCTQWMTCSIKTPMEAMQLELSQFFSNISLYEFSENYDELFSAHGVKND